MLDDLVVPHDERSGVNVNAPIGTRQEPPRPIPRRSIARRRRPARPPQDSVGALASDPSTDRPSATVPSGWGERPRWIEWMAWVGFGRLVGAALCVVVIVAGLWWLLRAPAVPVEQTLPVAGTAGPVATLAVEPGGSGRSEAGDEGLGSAAALGQDADGAGELLVVHVVGGVAVPGVYELEEDARVVDAIDAAGGLTDEADVDRLNLAEPLVDGARVRIPLRSDQASVSSGPTPVPGVGEVADDDLDDTEEEIVVVEPPSVGSPGRANDAGTPSIVNVNTATASELEQLPGVGPATAAAIVEDRERNGPFGSIDELERVSGIGPAKVAALRDLATT